MTVALQLLVIASVFLLTGSFAFALVFAHDPGDRGAGRAYYLNIAGLLLTAIAVVLMGVREHGIPLGTMSGSILVFALVMLIVSNGIAWFTRSLLILCILTPPVVLLEIVSLFSGQWFTSPDARAMLGNAFTSVHVALFMFSYAFFFTAAAFSVLFLLLDRHLKTKDYPPVFFKMPGLLKLDKWSFRSVAIGLALLTAAIGLAFGILRHFDAASRPAVARGLVADYTIMSTMLLWVYYAVYLLARTRLGLNGRRASYLTIAGVVLVSVFYLSGKVIGRSMFHGFEAPAIEARTR